MHMRGKSGAEFSADSNKVDRSTVHGPPFLKYSESGNPVSVGCPSVADNSSRETILVDLQHVLDLVSSN